MNDLFKMTTKQDLIDLINRDNLHDIYNNRIHKQVSSFIKSQEVLGKTKVDSWWEKRCKKHFEDMGWNVRFYRISGQLYLIVSEKNVNLKNAGSTSENEARMFLGYNVDMANLTQDIFEERNVWYGKEAEARINNRNNLISPNNDFWLSNAAQAICNFKNAKYLLESYMGDSGPSNVHYYHIRDLADYVTK